MSKREETVVSQAEFEMQDKYIEELNRIDGRKKLCHIETYGCPFYVVRCISYVN